MQVNVAGVVKQVQEPSVCPHCHNGIAPVVLTHSIGKVDAYASAVYVIWNCTFSTCRNLFVSMHEVVNSHDTVFVRFLDGTPIVPTWPNTIQNLESKFMATYKQALQAESNGLDEISGMGYRKAIEYLVKDYVLLAKAGDKSKIQDQLLAKVIAENFNEPREADLKDLLQRATWLGNDMTHYLKYHETFDINDLKELIRLVVDEIHSIEQKKHYISNIQSKYNKA